jgi:hypothetical protein
MARVRTIKPGFFLNEQLAELPALGRILFAGLWCIADRSGRLEDRPRKIKVETLPYDDCDVDALLDDLAAAGLIIRYLACGEATPLHGEATPCNTRNREGVGGPCDRCDRYIEIVNFARHQHPHPREPESEIPPPRGSSGAADSTYPQATESTDEDYQQEATPLHGAPRDAIARHGKALPGRVDPGSSDPGSSDPDHTHTARARAKPKRVTEVDDAFRAQMVERYHDQTSPERITDEIDDALGHDAARKRHDKKAYIRTWLARTDWNRYGRNDGGAGARNVRGAGAAREARRGGARGGDPRGGAATGKPRDDHSDWRPTVSPDDEAPEPDGDEAGGPRALDASRNGAGGAGEGAGRGELRIVR